MKLSYFGYSIEDIKTAQQYCFDIRPFISAYNKTKTVFKSGFTHRGDHIFLLPFMGDVYQFIITREDEIIKKIKYSDLSVSKISDMLNDGDKIGFTSYVYFGDFFIGFASTIKAPKSKIFSNFMSDLFSKAGMEHYSFLLHPFMKCAIKEEVMHMPFIGTSKILITKYNNVFQDLKKMFKLSDDDIVDVNSFEIIIRPKPRKNIESSMKKIIEHTCEDGMEKFILKAKEDLDDNLNDFYLVGQGQISNLLKSNTEEEIVDQIHNAAQNNMLLKKIVEEFKNNGAFKKKEPQGFNTRIDASTWPDWVGNV